LRIASFTVSRPRCALSSARPAELSLTLTVVSLPAGIEKEAVPTVADRERPRGLFVAAVIVSLPVQGSTAMHLSLTAARPLARMVTVVRASVTRPPAAEAACTPLFAVGGGVVAGCVAVLCAVGVVVGGVSGWEGVAGSGGGSPNTQAAPTFA
jgi:hypothetical protein